MYYLGIDGSATYTKVIGMDKDMRQLGKHMGATIRLDASGAESARAGVAKLLKEYSKATGARLLDCAGICIGSPSVRTHEDAALLESFLREAGAVCPVKAVNDIQIILASHTRGGPGMVISCGIRGVGYALDEHGATTLVGGWGHMVDDGCSAYSIGMKAIKYALMCYDGRIPATSLQEKVRDYFQIKHITDVTDFLYNTEKFNISKIAGLAIAVKYASDEGDEAARFIEATTSQDIFLLASGLVRSCRLTGELLLAGNVLSLNDSIRDQFRRLFEEQHPDVSVVIASERAEMGAVYLAMQVGV